MTDQQEIDSSERAEKRWKFSKILENPVIRERWDKVRKYFFLRESTYDMTNRCNIRCDGCYYYKGEKPLATENRKTESWQNLMQAEKERGITFVVLAGAEPSLVPELCEICYRIIPLGAIATNGLHVIPRHIGYKIHVSVWGNDETSFNIRRAQSMLSRQIENYIQDPRAVFIYTFNRHNIDEVHEVADLLVRNDCRISFNMFSAPVGYNGNLSHTETSLRHVRQVMMDVMGKYPDHVLFSPYNVVAHTHKLGLHDLYGCSYPRMNVSTDVGLGRTFRQYRTDLTWDRSAACCVPDTDCSDCRHYASGSAVVTSRLFRHATHPETFRSWLDYVDTYLAVWVMRYEKGPNLNPDMVPPPGHTLFEA